MNEISCEICMDLIPLVMDGVASEGSRKAVEAHIHGCGACRSLYAQGGLPQGNGLALEKAMRQVRRISRGVAAALILSGILLMEFVMRGSSVFFLGAVWAIWQLWRMGLKKEKSSWKRWGAMLMAAALAMGLAWGMNEIFGNPLSKAQAKREVDRYLKQTHGVLETEMADISYNMSSGAYDARIQIIEREFEISWRNGEILYDTFWES